MGLPSVGWVNGLCHFLGPLVGLTKSGCKWALVDIFLKLYKCWWNNLALGRSNPFARPWPDPNGVDWEFWKAGIKKNYRIYIACAFHLFYHIVTMVGYLIPSPIDLCYANCQRKQNLSAFIVEIKLRMSNWYKNFQGTNEFDLVKRVRKLRWARPGF